MDELSNAARDSVGLSVLTLQPVDDGTGCAGDEGVDLGF
jgi:hypothetical protein